MVGELHKRATPWQPLHWRLAVQSDVRLQLKSSQPLSLGGPASVARRKLHIWGVHLVAGAGRGLAASAERGQSPSQINSRGYLGPLLGSISVPIYYHLLSRAHTIDIILLLKSHRLSTDQAKFSIKNERFHQPGK